MDGSLSDLSRYRLERAKEDLRTAKDNFDNGSYRASINRSYYVDSAFRLREKADYDDFYVAAIEDAKRQIENAEAVIAAAETYASTRW